MAQPVPFIGREEELACIDQAIGEWGTRQIICIQGEGGVGKTRLLQEVRERYLRAKPLLAEDKAHQDITVVVVNEFLQTGWGQNFSRGIKTMAEELNVQLIEKDAHFNIGQMAVDLETVIDQSPDVIIVRLGTDEKLRPAIERAIRCGIKVLTLDNFLPNVNGLTSRVVTNEDEGAAILFEMMASAIQFQGTVAALLAKGGVMQQRRLNVVNSLLPRHPDIALVVEHIPLDSNMENTAYERVLDLLQTHPELKALWVTWDQLTRGALRALWAAQRTDILMYSFDLSDLDTELMLQAGSPWYATLAATPVEIGRVLIRLAVNVVNGEEIQRYFSVPLQLITQEALQKAVAANKPWWNESEIGWTPLLRTRVQKLHPIQKTLVTEPIDLDNHLYYTPQNLGYKIAESVNEAAFTSYLRELQDYYRIEKSGISSEKVAQEQKEVARRFLECFNEVTGQQRVALLFDTVEAISNMDILKYVLELSQRINNIVLVLAGRPEAKWEVLSPYFGSMVRTITLEPLGEEASEQYLQRKQDNLRVILEPELSQKLLLLAHGRPILIDLAVEWLARNIPLPWLTEITLKELSSLSSDELKKKQQEFESQLVQHIRETRGTLDWLVLMLARVYPLDKQMVIELLHLSEDAASILLEEARAYVYIKSLPDGRVTLHDEMRRMINTYAWPAIDLSEERRRRDSGLIAQYFAAQVQQLQPRINALKQSNEIAITLENDLWLAQRERLDHLLFCSIPEGVNLFIEVFDAATDSYDIQERSILMDVIEKYIGEIPPDAVYQVQVRRIRHLRDYGDYIQAQQIADEILQDSALALDRKLDILTLKASCHERLGAFNDAAGALRKALSICQTTVDFKRWQGAILNSLGRVNRAAGHSNEAEKYYQEALRIAEDKIQIAAALNNIGHLCSEQGRYRSALSYCSKALCIYQQENKRLQEGATFTTIGEIYRNWGKYKEALEHYNQALQIFQPEGDPFWLTRTYAYLGATYRLAGELELAENLLKRSIAQDEKALHSWVYHVLGCVYLNLDNYDEAIRCFNVSEQLGVEFHDIRSHINNLVGFAELYYEQWVKSKDATIAQQIQDKAATLEAVLNQGYNFPHHQARMQRVLANLNFDMANYEAALPIYAEAYAKLGIRTAGYAINSDFFQELDTLAERMRFLARIDPEKARAWCAALRKYWSDSQREIMRRDELESLLDILEIELNFPFAQTQDDANV
ncbi:MAG TPA: tetratricopeptide repeat protein [Anaerolineae bacterium]|nr:tetratricopeptide repeat protein [Anaerolineae bacterium]